MLHNCKRILALCLVLVLAVSLAACGNGSSQNVTTAPSTAPAGDGQTYTVTLDPNGGAFADGSTEKVTLTVDGGTAIDFPSYMPEYEGNTLYGWYLPDGMPWPGAKKVTSDLTLKAKWSVTQTVEVFDLALTDASGNTIYLEYDNGVYQFTKVSHIYGGYAQRSGKYTVNEEDLWAAINGDDGSTGRVLYKAESNYVDATGSLYGEFYNDGQFELFYDYTNDGKRTKYSMETGTWTLVDYEAPVEGEAIGEDGNNGKHTHEGWDTSLLGGSEEPVEDPTEPVEIPYEVIPGQMILEVGATESETMKLHFCDNGILTVFMTTYNMNIDKNYTWSYGEEAGLVISLKGGEENLAVDNGDGTYGLNDNYGNAYVITLADLLAAIPAANDVYTANASNSETMTLHFLDTHTVEIKFDLTAYGMAGQYSTVSTGQWSYDAENGLAVAIGGTMMVLTDDGAGNLTCEQGGNTYVIVLADLIAAIGG